MFHFSEGRLENFRESYEAHEDKRRASFRKYSEAYEDKKKASFREFMRLMKIK